MALEGKTRHVTRASRVDNAREINFLAALRPRTLRKTVKVVASSPAPTGSKPGTVDPFSLTEILAMPNNRLSAALCAMLLAFTAATLSAQSQYSQVTAASQKQVGPLGQSVTLVLMDFTLTLNPGETGSMTLPSVVLNPNQTAHVHVAGYLKYQDATVSQVSSVAMGFSCPGASSPNSEVTLTQTGQFTIETSQPIDDETVLSNTTSQATAVSCTLLVRHQSATGSAPILFGVSPGTAAVRFSVTILTN